MAEKLSLAQLPTEIMSQIFLHCLPWMSSPQIWSDPFRLAPTFDSRNAPLLLIHVCRQWRLVAEATSILWTRLPTMQSTTSKALELYKMYIENSGEAPLWMHLTSVSGAIGQEVADILVAHSHRWEHLSLTFQTYWGDTDVKISNLPTHLPSLKYLHLQHIYLSSLDERNLNRLPKLITPRLRSLRIPSPKVLGLNLPWSQLTHYSGKFDRWQDAQAFLSRCTNLEVLDLHNPNQSFHTLSEISLPTHLPRLRDLSLVNEQVRLNYYHSLIDCLVLPVLETVCIGVDQDHSILEALCRCIARSSLGGAPRLRSVEVRCPQTLGVSQRSLRELSLVAPGIQELKITRPCPGALSAMRFHPTNAFLFPCLQHLTLIHPHLRDSELADIISSRCHPPPSDLHPCTRLRHVEVMLMEEPASEYLSMKRHKLKRCRVVQPLHEEFQDVAECFTDDPDFRQMYKKLKRILVVRELCVSRPSEY